MQRRVDTGSLTLLGEKKRSHRSASIDAETSRRPIRDPDLIRSLGKTEKGLSVMMMNCSTTKLNMGNNIPHSFFCVKLKLKLGANICLFAFHSPECLFTHNSIRSLVTVPLSQVRESLLSLFGATHGFTGPARTTTLPVLGTLKVPLFSRERSFGKPIVQGWL